MLADTRTILAFGTSLMLHLAVVLLALGTPIAPRIANPLRADVWTGDTVEIENLAPSPTAEAAEPAAGAAPAEPVRASEESPSTAAPQAVRPGSGSLQRNAVADVTPVAAPNDEYGEQWIRVEDQLPTNEDPPENVPALAQPAERRRGPEPSIAERVLAFRPKEAAPDAGVARPAAVGTAVGSMPGPVVRRELVRAFTRAIPAVNTRDPAWSRLPLGAAGEIRITIRVAEDGSVADVEHPDDSAPHLVRLIKRTVLALRGGRFELLDKQQHQATIELKLRISQKPLESGPLELGFEAPQDGRPGRAYFQLPSGRFVEVEVEEIR